MQKVNFENSPSTDTPINATNLNLVQTNVENEFTNYVGKPTELYSSTSGNYSSTINLSANISTFDYVEILFTDGDGANNSVKVYTKNQTSVKALLVVMAIDGNYLFQRIGEYTLNGTTLNQGNVRLIRFSNTPSLDYINVSNNSIGIKKVLGYK